MAGYDMLPGQSNDPEGNCEREWRRSAPDRLHASTAHALVHAYGIPALRCPDCTALWPDFDSYESCPGCGLSREDVEAGADLYDRLRKEAR